MTKLLDFLQHLFDKGYSWSTIAVNRSAVSSVLEGHCPDPVGKHPTVSRFLRGVFNRRPPASRVVPIWDVNQVISSLSAFHPPEEMDLPTLSKKVAFLLATCTAKRVSDLLLFSVADSLCHLSEDCIVLQTAFGSKTDRPSHRAPPVKLLRCADRRLCPVSYLKEYIRRTGPLRGGATQLFLSVSAPHRPVKLPTLKRWISSVLLDAGVVASPGSTRAAVTSCAVLRDVPLQTIMDCADWSRQSTPLRHYLRVLPKDALRAAGERTVQAAVLGD